MVSLWRPESILEINRIVANPVAGNRCEEEGDEIILTEPGKMPSELRGDGQSFLGSKNAGNHWRTGNGYAMMRTQFHVHPKDFKHCLPLRRQHYRAGSILHSD